MPDLLDRLKAALADRYSRLATDRHAGINQHSRSF